MQSSANGQFPITPKKDEEPQENRFRRFSLLARRRKTGLGPASLAPPRVRPGASLLGRLPAVQPRQMVATRRSAVAVALVKRTVAVAGLGNPPGKRAPKPAKRPRLEADGRVVPAERNFTVKRKKIKALLASTIPDEELAAHRAKALQIQTQLFALYDDPPCPLHHSSAFQLLVCVCLSAQTTDKKVNEVTPALFEVAPDAGSMSQMEVCRMCKTTQHRV